MMRAYIRILLADLLMLDRPARTESGGTPFAVDWLRTDPLPFGRTRHILNSFNSGREVKISRDGAFFVYRNPPLSSRADLTTEQGPKSSPSQASN